MNSSDLMIGNYVYDTDEKCYTSISLYDFKEEYFHLYEPIELTEEILLKCGFVRDGNTDYYTCRKVGFTINLSGIIGYRTCIWSNKHIKHLHQLQNLYWCLCGKELNIQL